MELKEPHGSALLQCTDRGELFAIQLRLHPLEAGWVAANAGPQLQAAFLDLVRQADAALAEALHLPHRRRPYTLGMLQGFNTLTPSQQTEALERGQELAVHPSQVYWLRLTVLDDALFDTLNRVFLLKAQELILRVGTTRFAVSRIITRAEDMQEKRSWVATSSFASLYQLVCAQDAYHFEFHTPTVFSLGNKSWGKHLHLFPEPAYVFESIANQWENVAPQPLRLSVHALTPHSIGQWCAEHLVASHYALTTSHLYAKKFGQVGFKGTITYEVKGNRTASEALWLSLLARFAFFSGVGYKTTMGMGQTRCLSLPPVHSSTDLLQEVPAV